LHPEIMNIFKKIMNNIPNFNLIQNIFQADCLKLLDKHCHI
jgi:hypothetical protein